MMLKEYKRVFSALSYENSLCAGSKGSTPSIFATFEDLLDKQPSQGANKQGHSCSCLKKGETYQQDLGMCMCLEYIITGTTTQKLKSKLTTQEVNDIKNQITLPKQKQIVKKRGQEKHLQSKQRAGRSKTKRSTLTRGEFLGSINVALLDLYLISEISESTTRVYAMLDYTKHPLSNSTLFDNCKAMNLVNNKDRLVPRTF